MVFKEPGTGILAALLVGVGASLVLDEFAMIFRLQDVYWSQEGQLSVNVVTLAAACVGLAANASRAAPTRAETWVARTIVILRTGRFRGSAP